LLDGAIGIDQLIDFGKKHQLPSLAISDHGNIFGAVRFYQACKKAGIKPVIGIETYLTEDIAVKDNENRYYHLLLLVQNATGYKNLCKILHIAYTKGFYFKPRIDYKILRQYSEGLIATSSCLGGHIPQLLLQNNQPALTRYLDEMRSIFGEDRYFLEVQPEDQPEQKIVNTQLFRMSKEMGIPIFASADCHYASLEDRYAHEVMLAIQTHHKMTDPDRMTFGECLTYMRTPQEMLEAFPENPDAIWQAGAIADLCNFEFQMGKYFFPSFPTPNQETEPAYFERICTEGLQKLFDTKRIITDTPEAYWDRLKLEMALIGRMGFITYFLVVSDFIQWAKNNGIPVGPGRGSAAGSLVAWATGITDIDPLRYNLLFERFLNPERVSMPDIDIDFCIEGRERVIEYVREKYGHDKVCQIITFGTMQAKGVVKDVARALGIPFEDANAITNLIPDQLKITLAEAFEQEPKLAQIRDSNQTAAQLFAVASRLEGLTRHASKHAAGIVIAPEPIEDILPLYVPPKTNDLVTQYAMTELEVLGYLKMDFLGLKNLTLIKRVVEFLKKNRQIDLDVAYLPLDDAETFALLGRGDTTGVFQFEGSGVKDVMRRLKPEGFEDIIAVNALYRPGPLGSGMVDDFIKRRHGEQKIEYIFPELEPILQETYGVIVYQEQVMKIASAIGSYSLGEADILRRAMGKKKADVMAQNRAVFVERATKSNFDSKKAGELFDLMAYFAGYGFNKSHSAAYGLIAYQTAYLKAHYPVEFMSSLISLESRDPETMALYIQAAREMDIEILQPDINQSEHFFVPEGTAIRFGLIGIKNAGSAGLDVCFEERRTGGPFKDLLDFCIRVDLRTCNKRFIESLIAAGAFDSLPGNRAQKTDELAQVMDKAAEHKQARLTGQMGLFAQFSPTSKAQEPDYMFSPAAEWADTVKLEKEKEVLGIYLSARPLDRFKKQLQWLKTVSFRTARESQGTVMCAGSLTTTRVISTKKGDRMAFVGLEDYSGQAEIVVFPKLFAKATDILSTHSLFLVEGQVDEAATSGCKIKANTLQPLESVLENWSSVERLTLTIPKDKDPQVIIPAQQSFLPGRTALEIVFYDHDKRVRLVAKNKITTTLETLSDLHDAGIEIAITLAR
jgi:DNA polymerase-3 subunit alpha